MIRKTSIGNGPWRTLVATQDDGSRIASEASLETSRSGSLDRFRRASPMFIGNGLSAEVGLDPSSSPELRLECRYQNPLPSKILTLRLLDIHTFHTTS